MVRFSSPEIRALLVPSLIAERIADFKTSGSAAWAHGHARLAVTKAALEDVRQLAQLLGSSPYQDPCIAAFSAMPTPAPPSPTQRLEGERSD